MLALLLALSFTACTAIEEYIPNSVTEEQDDVTLTSTVAQIDITEESEESIEELDEDDTEEVEKVEIVLESIETSADNPPTSATLSFYDVTLIIGEQKMPIVTMYPTDSDNKDEIWISSDESVATVDDMGLITAVGEGKCVITMTASANHSVSEEVNVTVITSNDTDEDGNILPQSITLSTTEVTLDIGDTKMPIVTMYPEDAYNKDEVWISSDESVATVDDMGLITAVGLGACTITVKSAVNSSAVAYVSVTVADSDAVEPTYINGILVVNKTYALPKSYGSGVDATAQAAFEEMAAAAKEDGISLWIASGYRSYDYQQGLYDRYVSNYGQAEADRFSARPGHSEHQTGLAFDLNVIDDSFAGTPEAEWIAANCYKYGFIVRYPEGKEDITGYKYEPWHVRYLGVETATAVYESGLTLEEYLGITSEYKD